MRFLFEEKKKQKSIRMLTCLITVIFFSVGTWSCSSNGDDGSKDPIELPPVVFTADKDVAGKVELYTSFNSGTNVIKISNTGVSGQVSKFQISPDGTQVAYLSNAETSSQYELYVVAIDGGTSKKVSGTLDTNTSVEEDFAWSTDNTYVAFRKFEDSTSGLELFTVEPDLVSPVADVPTRVSGELAVTEEVTGFSWAPTGTNEDLIAYRSDEEDLSTTFALYTTKADGTGNVLASIVSSTGNVEPDFAWSPNGEFLAYRGNLRPTGATDLFTRLIQPPTNTTVSNNGLVGSREVLSFAWSHDTQWIAYVADQNFDNVYDLYATRPTLTGSNKLTQFLGTGNQDVRPDIAWSPNLLIAFRANRNNDNVFELFTTTPSPQLPPINQVSGTITAVGGNVSSFAWAPDGNRIAYYADQSTFNVFELHTTAPTTVDDQTVSSAPNVKDDYAWSPDSSLIAFRADQDTPNVIELYSATATGAIGNKVSGSILVANGSVKSFKWEQDGFGIAYTANQEDFLKIELYTSRPDGADNTKISGDITPPDGDVFDFDWVP